MTTNKTLTMIDLFCGTGGFAEGFLKSKSSYKLLYAIDADRVASETTRANHTKTRVDHGDIRKVDIKGIQKDLGVSEVDLIIGGPPCQGFSSLRPNRSSKIADERNNLFSYYVKFVKSFHPKVFILENVVGLATHDKGNTLEIMIDAFTNLGYSVDWRILNAASFGVPQKRERLIMIGSRTNGPISFPKPMYHFNGKAIGYKDKSRVLLANNSKQLALTVNDAIGDLPILDRGELIGSYDQAPLNNYQKERRAKSTLLTLHKAANHSDKMMEVIRHSGDNITCIPSHLITSGFSSCYSRLNGDEPSTTITVKFQSPASSKCIHPEQHRTITPREAARIQSFNDDYIFKGSLTQIASQLGNAVPPLLGRALSNAMSKHLV